MDILIKRKREKRNGNSTRIPVSEEQFQSGGRNAAGITGDTPWDNRIKRKGGRDTKARQGTRTKKREADTRTTSRPLNKNHVSQHETQGRPRLRVEHLPELRTQDHRQAAVEVQSHAPEREQFQFDLRIQPVEIGV